MKLFLIIVGAVVTAFALCLVMLVVWLRWMTRKLRASLNELGGLAEKLGGPVPPLRIELKRIEAADWQSADALLGPLLDAGFERIGNFEMAPGDVKMQALTLPAENVLAVVYEHPQAGVWLDLVARYQDGGKLTYATIADTLLDRAENNVIEYHEGMPADELLRRFLAERPAKPTIAVPREDFAAYFEQAYAESMDWMIARGGPTEAEIRRHCEKKGQEFTPLLVTAIRGRWAVAIDEFYDERLQEQFRDKSAKTAAAWDAVRDRLVFVHDRMAPARLEELCEHESGEDEDGDGLYDARPASSALAGDPPSPRAVFARYNASLPRDERYRKLGELSQPLAADVYMSPTEE